MNRANFLGRALLGLCLAGSSGLVTAAAQAQPEDNVEPTGEPPPPVTSVPSSGSEGAVPTSVSGTSNDRGLAFSGVASEAAVPSWMTEAAWNAMAVEWHGNIELDVGQVNYTWENNIRQPEKVYDSRGRFVLGPLLSHKFGNGLTLRVTGQAVAWVREDYNFYQINADDVYVQIGKDGLWDFMAGRFLTWRVFRKGLGFDLYTLEDTGARVKENFTDQGGFFPHAYEVNTIFLRDSFTVPAGRAAFHLYPTSWIGAEAVVSYGRLQSGGNALGGRVAVGVKAPFVNVLFGGEYEGWKPAQALGMSDPKTMAFVPSPTRGRTHLYGVGGSISLTPVRFLELVGDYAYRNNERWDLSDVYINELTQSYGAYAQVDVGALVFYRPLVLGGGYFKTEFSDNDDAFKSHDQWAAYIVYPLGFNNSVLKLVYSRANGHQERKEDPHVDGNMESIRLRFALYY